MVVVLISPTPPPAASEGKEAEEGLLDCCCCLALVVSESRLDLMASRWLWDRLLLPPRLVSHGLLIGEMSIS